LGEIYNNLPTYEDGPCSPCATGEDSTTVSPHGRVTNLTGACSKLIVFKAARVVDGDFVYDGDPLVLFSRKRKSLPAAFTAFGSQQCTISNPLHCPAENGLRNVECCRTCTKTSGDPPVTRETERCISYAGPYLNVDYNETPATGSCVGCASKTPVLLPEWREQELGFGFSPCVFDSMETCRGDLNDDFVYEVNCEDFEQEATQRVLAGYAIDNNPTWLLDEEEEVFPIVKQAIIDNDPLGAFPHTVYLHYQLSTFYIRCCQSGKNYVGLSDDDERERAVNVLAALGFSCQLCGIDPEKACEEIYEE
jgi:hypothetical protein